MNKQNIVRITLVIFINVVLVSPLFAQTQVQTAHRVTREVNGQTITAEVPQEQAPTEENFNRYKNDLLIILNAQRATLVTMQINGFIANIDSAIAQVQAMKFSELGENYPGFPDLTALKNAVVGQRQLMAEAYARGGVSIAQFTPGDPFPPTVYASFCPLNPQPPEVAFTSGLVKLAADLVGALAQDFCQQITSILGGGGNFALACIVTDIIKKAAAFVDYPIQQCHIDTGVIAPTGAIFNRLDYIHNQLDYSIANDNTNKALLSTQLTNAENHVIVNDNNNKAALSSQIDTIQTLAVRLAIEANLAEDPTSLAGADIFEMPASQGGYLEVARQILIDVYNAHVAAAGPGVTVYNPSSELSIGANFTSQRKYREAYYYYRRGYRSVVKYP